MGLFNEIMELHTLTVMYLIYTQSLIHFMMWAHISNFWQNEATIVDIQAISN
jgi:hypothetical protein